ncbi:beta-glucosidase [Gillisia sp. Hel_I_86]|uniref:GH1 family beta-glucosidase n=1 Tax=Gillisia sp. Hel_I_86 TaxID=1249981 RepID=UPI00119A4444|nr:GH1 family beta-glucosidase [Gillisia sp. Hel_I_86]TVZ25867.1 beta-glucosidase [Gillisia sp. Hel_I_86]
MIIQHNSFKAGHDRFSKEDFGTDFKFGVSAAAFQTEGSVLTDGKGLSIWDVFSEQKGKIYKGQDAREACDFYNRFEQDLLLMKSMNIANFRFSLSWPRILPKGIGKSNSKGIDFYNKVIDKCLELGIAPWITLYHWDLPQALEDKGGWTNRKIIDWFTGYVSLCAREFGDRVKNWMVLNEPLVFTGAGYFLGVHAPGKKGLKNFLPAMHHAAICQAEGGRILRDILPEARIGTTFSCSLIEPYRNIPKDQLAVKRVDALVNRLFLEPALGLGYPREDLKFLKHLDNYFLTGDEDLLKFNFDFIGLQNYTREVVKHTCLVPYIQAINIKATKRKVPVTTMQWEIFPQGIYEMLKRFDSYKGIKNIIVTENGAAFPDKSENGKIEDPERLDYIRKYLEEVLKAKKEGVNVKGYFIWSFTDNFEWAEGYHPRFGLVHINYKTQERTIKSSGNWYSDFLKQLVRKET